RVVRVQVEPRGDAVESGLLVWGSRRDHSGKRRLERRAADHQLELRGDPGRIDLRVKVLEAADNRAVGGQRRGGGLKWLADRGLCEERLHVGRSAGVDLQGADSLEHVVLSAARRALPARGDIGRGYGVTDDSVR